MRSSSTPEEASICAREDLFRVTFRVVVNVYLLTEKISRRAPFFAPFFFAGRWYSLTGVCSRRHHRKLDRAARDRGHFWILSMSLWNASKDRLLRYEALGPTSHHARMVEAGGSMVVRRMVAKSPRRSK